MKDKKTIKAIIAIVILLIIGIAIIVTKKFEYSVDYSKNVRIELYLGKSFEINDILEIANDVYENEKIIVQKAGPFQDTIAITVKSTTDEQNNKILNKINEKYETSITTEDLNLYYNSNYRGRDIIEQYLIAGMIAGIAILVIFVIRYKKIGILKVISSVIAIFICTQVLYLTLTSIFNMQINNITIASYIAILIFCLIYLSSNYEKALNKHE